MGSLRIKRSSVRPPAFRSKRYGQWSCRTKAGNQSRQQNWLPQSRLIYPRETAVLQGAKTDHLRGKVLEWGKRTGPLRQDLPTLQDLPRLSNSLKEPP